MHDVVVIGAGLAGGSLATALGNRGWNVLLAERDQFPRHKVCGEFISPEAQASMQALGVYNTVAALGPVPMREALLVSQRGVELTMPLPGAAWGVSRFVVDEALAAAATQAGVDVQTGTAVSEFVQQGDRWTVTLRTPAGTTHVETRAVIMACGRHPLPKLRPSAPGTPIERTFVGAKCHYANVAMPPRVELFLFPGGYVGISPVEGGLVNVCLLATRDAFTAAGGTVRGILDAAIAASPRLAQCLAQGEPVPASEVAVAPVDLWRRAVPWDRVARLGDAGAMIPPLCGDGMAIALRSAELCAPFADDFLAGRCSLAAWQAAYSTAWRRSFTRPVFVGRRLQALLGVPTIADALFRCGRVAPSLANTFVQATRCNHHAVAEGATV